MTEKQYVRHLKDKDKSKSVIYKNIDNAPVLGEMPHCPNCNVVLLETYGRGNYCANCGQKLKWEEQDNEEEISDIYDGDYINSVDVDEISSIKIESNSNKSSIIDSTSVYIDEFYNLHKRLEELENKNKNRNFWVNRISRFI